MGALPLAALLALASEVKGDVQAGATVSQQIGEIPTGAAGPGAAGGSVLSYDSILRPELRLQLADENFTASLFYDPRLLLRVQFPEGASSTVLSVGQDAMGEGGRPFLVLHSFQGAATYRIAPRWTWSSTLIGIVGEQDFAQVLADGAGGGGAGGAPRAQVLNSTSVGGSSTLIGPLVGRNDFRTTLSVNLTYPEAEGLGGMSVEPAPGDSLCFGDVVADGSAANAALVGIADTCAMSLTTATIHPLSDLDRLEFQAGYEAIDFDPGPFIHALSADVLWRRRLTRDVETRVRAGFVAALDANPADGQDALSPLPRADLGLGWRILNRRLLQVNLDLALGADGFIEAISRRYLLRTSATAALSATIRRDLSLGLRVNAFTLAPELGCPPRLAVTNVRTEGCPDDLSMEERGAEIPDLTGFSTEANLSWALDRHVSFLASGRYAFRAPHLTRIGDPMAVLPEGEQAQREISAQVGLRVVFGTRNDLGS